MLYIVKDNCEYRIYITVYFIQSIFVSYFVNRSGDGATVELILLSLLSFLAHLIFKRRSLWSNLCFSAEAALFVHRYYYFDI
jgi:hypothetical protein